MMSLWGHSELASLDHCSRQNIPVKYHGTGAFHGVCFPWKLVVPNVAFELAGLGAAALRDAVPTGSRVGAYANGFNTV